MTRLLRFRFSLSTLLIAMAWSAVAVWMNVTPQVGREPLLPVSHRVLVSDVSPFAPMPKHLEGRLADCMAYYGVPWDYAWFEFYDDTTRPVPPRLEFSTIDRYDALAGDAAVGVLFVVVLTWGSNQLLRRVGAKLRRRSAAKLGEQQALDSPVE